MESILIRPAIQGETKTEVDGIRVLLLWPILGSSTVEDETVLQVMPAKRKYKLWPDIVPDAVSFGQVLLVLCGNSLSGLRCQLC